MPVTNRWDAGAIEYTDVKALREALVGKQIVSTVGTGGDYPADVKFVLDDGSILTAHSTDGGCACSNGCFDVKPQNNVRGTILNVEIRETLQTWDGSPMRDITPGSVSDGGATISVFVYTELGESLLLTSEGGDNGYYGWGFWLDVQAPNVEEPTA
jgi:hypothetical protein